MRDKVIWFACPRCGQKGVVVWRDGGAERVLVRLSEGFHVEEGRQPGERHVIICSGCGEVDPLPSDKSR
jgi:hypothetical protein